MLKSKVQIVATVVLAVFLIGCGYTRVASQRSSSQISESVVDSTAEDGSENSGTSQSAEGIGAISMLEGRTWLLTSVNGRSIPYDMTERPIQIKLIPDGKRVVGFAGCNSIMSSYEVEEGTLRFGQIGATKVFCPGVMKTESEFIAALARVTNYTITGNVLELSTGAELLASFEAADDLE